MKKILILPADKAGCGKYRMYLPFREIQRRGPQATGVEIDFFEDVYSQDTISSIFLANIVGSYDAVVFQRVSDSSMVNVMQVAKNFGVKIFMDLDDDLFNVHVHNPAYRVWNKTSPAVANLKKAISICDGLLLSTPELVFAHKSFGIDSVVCLNAIDLEDPIYLPENSRRSELPSDKVIVGWAGSTSHIDSLQQIVKPIKKIIEKCPNVIFALCSNKEFMDMFKIPEDRKTYIQHVKIDQWPKIMSMFDISIATVKPSAFNDCKSELKVLEAAVWGVPSVATYAAPYNRFKSVSDGSLQTIYENEANDWVRAVQKLALDPDYRMECGRKSREAMIKNYDLKAINDLRIEFILGKMQ